MTTVAILLCGLQTVQADRYGSLHLGLSIPATAQLTLPSGAAPQIDLKKGAAMGVAFGYHLTDQVRLEAEMGYQTASLSKFDFDLSQRGLKGNARSFSFLGSAYFDFTNSTTITPYIGAGVGLARVKIDDARFISPETRDPVNEGATVFACQLGLGASYHLTPEVNWDLGYRYYATAELPLEQADMSHASHNLYAGLRFAF